MTPSIFQPRLTRQEAKVLCLQYDADADFWFDAAGRCILEKNYSREHLDTIFAWKTKNRGKSRIQKNDAREIETVLRQVVESGGEPPSDSLKVLITLSGIDIPVASAVMTAVFPERFTVIDFRALDALGAKKYSTRSIKKYLEYASYCRNLAAEWHLSLRDLDRALWKWSEKSTGRLLQSKCCRTPA